jgi:hypothetical protein
VSLTDAYSHRVESLEALSDIIGLLRRNAQRLHCQLVECPVLRLELSQLWSRYEALLVEGRENAFARYLKAMALYDEVDKSPFQCDCLATDFGLKTGLWDRVRELIAQLEPLAHQEPSPRFCAILPIVPQVEHVIVQQVNETPICEICAQPNALQVKLCNPLHSPLCYSCLRNIAWAAQYDEYRAFSEFRPFNCPYCRHPMELGGMQLQFIIFQLKRTATLDNASKRIKI